MGHVYRRSYSDPGSWRLVTVDRSGSLFGTACRPEIVACAHACQFCAILLVRLLFKKIEMKNTPLYLASEIFPILSDGEGPVFTAARPLEGDDQLLDAYSKTIAAVVNRVAPSVVNIRVQCGARGQGGGSGFVIARDGFILTNSHVVQGARELEVTLHDGHVAAARLIGA